jgi:hypothetical protein
MGWKHQVGKLAATTVLAVARLQRVITRGLDAREQACLRRVFGAHGLDLARVRLAERVSGLVNLTNRPFTIENTIFLPPGCVPAREGLLVHEAVHVWQFQTAGHSYIPESVIAQATNRAYRLDLALRGEWSALNCEQQAVFVEHCFSLGAFDGQGLRGHLLPSPLFDDARRALQYARF